MSKQLAADKRNLQDQLDQVLLLPLPFFLFSCLMILHLSMFHLVKAASRRQTRSSRPTGSGVAFCAPFLVTGFLLLRFSITFLIICFIMLPLSELAATVTVAVHAILSAHLFSAQHLHSGLSYDAGPGGA